LPPTLVRSGPMLIEAGKFTHNPALTGTQPNAFGDFYWDFQNAFTYLGGDLAILFTHTGQAGSVIFLDYVTVPTTVAWLGSGYQATTGGAVHVACIARLHYGYGSPCPGTGGALPNLVITNDTTGGGNTTLALANAPANALAAFALGTIKVPLPLPNGCSLQTPPILVLPVTLGPQGRHSQTLSVPASAFGRVEIQGLVLDAGAPGGFTTTNGVTFTAR
jgi:hypothetical protein